MRRSLGLVLVCSMGWVVGCTSSSSAGPVNPDTAPLAQVDRFSADAGTLFVRDNDPSLPGPNEAIDFDQGPFTTAGLGPDGSVVHYYNFDVQPTTPAPIYVLFHDGDTMPVPDQLNIINVLPGQPGYNDFWRVYKVTVPADYEANTVTSYDEIVAAGYTVTPTDMLVNCPVVPQGSTATMRYNGGDASLHRGWYEGQVVFYFQFDEKMLSVVSGTGAVPVAQIYVTFNVNPDSSNPASGPASGFMTESGTQQTHNVADSVPTNTNYSPLWLVHIYDNADFGSVSDLSSAEAATQIGPGPTVNCPIF